MRRFLTNLSFILFGLTGLLGVAVSVHHLLRGPLPARQPQFLPSHAGPAAAPPAHGAHHGAMAHQNGAAAGGRGATGAVAPVVNGAALGRGDSGATWHEAGPGAGKAGSGGARGSQLVQARSGGEAGQAQGAVHGAEVRAAQSGEWPVYEVRPAASLWAQDCRHACQHREVPASTEQLGGLCDKLVKHTYKR